MCETYQRVRGGRKRLLHIRGDKCRDKGSQEFVRDGAHAEPNDLRNVCVSGFAPKGGSVPPAGGGLQPADGRVGGPSATPPCGGRYLGALVPPEAPVLASLVGDYQRRI